MGANKVQITLEAYNKTKEAFAALQNDLKGVQTEGGKIPPVFSAMSKGLAGYIGAAAGIAGVTAFLKSSVREAAEAEQIQNRLKFALENVGYQWEKVEGAIENYAEAVERSTRFSNDEAKKALSDMLMYTRDLEKAQKASTLAMDMSVRTGQDVASTTRLIGMALSGNVEMLGRYLPEFRNLDAVLGENATAAEKAAYAWNKLQEKFGGTAQADMNTYAGKTAALRNSIAKLQETIGNFLIPSLKDSVDWMRHFINEANRILTGGTVDEQMQAAERRWITARKNLAYAEKQQREGGMFPEVWQKQIAAARKEMELAEADMKRLEGEKTKAKDVKSLKDIPVPDAAKQKALNDLLKKQEEDYEKSLRIFFEEQEKLQNEVAKLEAEGKIKEAEERKRYLEERREAYIRHAGEVADIRQKEFNDIAKIEVKGSDERIKALEEDEKKFLEWRQKQWEEAGQKIVEENKKSSEETAQRWESTQSLVGGAFQAGLFDLFKSRTSSLKEKWKEFCDFMLDSFLRALATMSSNYLVFGNILGQQKGQSGGLMGLLGGLFNAGSYSAPAWATSSWATAAASVFHRGGIAGEEGRKFWEFVPRFHTGAGPDEILSVIDKREGVFTPGQMKAMGLMANRGGGQTVNIYPVIGPNVDAASFMALCRKHPGAIGEVILQDLRTAGVIRDEIIKTIGR